MTLINSLAFFPFTWVVWLLILLGPLIALGVWAALRRTRNVAASANPKPAGSAWSRFGNWVRSGWGGKRTWRGLLWLLSLIPVSIIAFFYLSLIWWGLVAFLNTFLGGQLILSLILLVLVALGLALLVRGARFFGKLYRYLTAKIMDCTIPEPEPFASDKTFFAKVNGGFTFKFKDFLGRLGAMLGDVIGWRVLLFMLLSLPLVAFGLGLPLLLLIGGVLAATYPFYWQRITTTLGIPSIYNTECSYGLLGNPSRVQCIFSDHLGNPIDPQPTLSVGAVLHGGGFEPIGIAHNPWDWNLAQSQWQIPLNTPGRIALVALMGLIALFFVPLILRAIANLLTRLAAALLGPTAGALKIQHLKTQRAAIVDNSETRLRQIERDLHDSIQAQLVTVIMQLGEVQECLEIGDLTLARQLVNRAQTQLNETTAELREIASGIHPPALDKGLGVALQTLVARCPVPVSLIIEDNIDQDPTTRAIAYFTISELLNNVVKHAQATKASVDVRRTAKDMKIMVVDDGIGGAQIISGTSDKQTGLIGLTERLASVDGALRCVSPAGGPTVIDVTIPLGIEG